MTTLAPSPDHRPAAPPVDADTARTSGHGPGRDLRGLVASVGRWYWEVLDGRRDPRQLRRLLSPACEQRVLLAARAAHEQRRDSGTGPGAVTAARTATARWRDDVCEGVALVERDGRTTAVTVVVQAHGDRLRVTDLARPEGGQRALRVPRA